jgi:hypothetical protein
MDSPELPLIKFVQQPCQAPFQPSTQPLTYAAVAAATSAALLQAKYKYVREGGVLLLMESLYICPSKVQQAGDQTFHLTVGSRKETVKCRSSQASLLPGTSSPCCACAKWLASTSPTGLHDLNFFFY